MATRIKYTDYYTLYVDTDSYLSSGNISKKIYLFRSITYKHSNPTDGPICEGRVSLTDTCCPKCGVLISGNGAPVYLYKGRAMTANRLENAWSSRENGASLETIIKDEVYDVEKWQREQWMI
jgi:hypothetical protein